MKFLMPLALAVTMFAGCSTNSAAEAKNPEEPSAREGWEDVKAGTKEAAAGAGEIAKDAGNAVVEGAKDAGHAVKAATCPVVGNKTTKVYYTKADKTYDSVLNGKKAIAYENRECFTSEANAREAGFKSSVK